VIKNIFKNASLAGHARFEPAELDAKPGARWLLASRFIGEERLGQYSKLLRAKSVLETIQQDPKLRRLQGGYYHQLPLRLATEPIKTFPTLLSRRLPFEHDTQRPTFYLPGLEAKPWWRADANSKRLVENLSIIRREFENISSRTIDVPEKYLVDKGQWLTFYLLESGKMREENCRVCPKTTEIIESLPLCHQATGVAYFSVMMPGTKVKPHCGPTNTRIRYHLTLSSDEKAWMRVGSVKKYWKSGECLVFDDSFEHEVQHHGDAPRVVFLLDCWHPGLTSLEREWVTQLYAQLKPWA